MKNFSFTCTVYTSTYALVMDMILRIKGLCTYMYNVHAALTVRPSCWNVLTPQCNVLVAVEEKLYMLDQYEAILQVRIYM